MKQIGSILTIYTASAVALVFSCTRSMPENKNALAYVGSAPVTQEDADAFEFVSQNMPGEQDTFGLVKGGLVWALIATEAVFRKAGGKNKYAEIRSGREWEWKTRVYLSRAFEIQILQGNCGYSDAEVRNYYDTHRNDFRAITYPETMKPCTLDVVPPFDTVRAEVAKRLFLSNYTHDSGSFDLRNPRFFAMFRERMYRDYFLKKYYAEKYGKPLPDSVMKLCGSGKVIDTGDIAIVLSWMAPADREEHKKDQGFIIRRMVQWKLFADRAASSGYASRPEVRAILEYAWKSEMVRKYVNKVLVPEAESAAAVDPDMALFSYWDETGMPSPVIDSAKLKKHIARLSEQKKTVLFDGLVYRIRSKTGVRFLRPDTWSDGRIKEPSALLKEADSFRDSGDVSQAQTIYGILTDYYLFTAEGKKALFELAKLQAEQQEQGWLDAVRNFRRFLILDSDRSRRCEAMFRIAFIYDQFLNRNELAGANYRWVLENVPDCNYAADAEVMLRHLGEPMPDAEVLREEAKRR